MLNQQAPPQYQYQQQQQGMPSLAIVAHGAQNLVDVEAFGKQDPYVQFSLDFNNAKSFQKTFVHKNAGKNPVWNQSFNLPLQGEPELFVEIMDEETTADAVIAFAAIPINQIVHAPGGTLNGVFDVFTPDGKQQGQINLTLTAHNVPGQNTGYGAQGGVTVRGTSHISELHQRRMKSLKNKERAADVGTAALGGLLAVGAGFLANKLVNDHNREEEARKAAERNAQQEKERFEAERRRLEEERANFARTQQEEQARFQQQQSAFQQQQQQYQQQQQQQNQYQQPQYQQPQYQQPQHGGYEHHDHHDHHKKHHDSDSGSDSDGSYKKKKGKKWEGYGWYSAGDKVKYEGRKYICLQGHNAQGDWAPTVAHSLWRAD